MHHVTSQTTRRYEARSRSLYFENLIFWSQCRNESCHWACGSRQQGLQKGFVTLRCHQGQHFLQMFPNLIVHNWRNMMVRELKWAIIIHGDSVLFWQCGPCLSHDEIMQWHISEWGFWAHLPADLKAGHTYHPNQTVLSMVPLHHYQVTHLEELCGLLEIANNGFGRNGNCLCVIVLSRQTREMPGDKVNTPSVTIKLPPKGLTGASSTTVIRQHNTGACTMPPM